jgi:predicted Rossmann fold flavoprotein
MLELRAASGKCLVSFTNSTLFTHFGLSGPSVLDISRYYLVSRDDGARLVINFLPGETPESFDAALQRLGRRSVSAFFRERLPERLALALCDAADVEPQTPGTALTRERRRTLARTATECELPIAGDRGFTHAEATAGGVPLAELHLQTMESRACPGLHVVGEICDVDGRIGGFNFQWAWSSGYGAGVAAGRGVSARVG